METNTPKKILIVQTAFIGDVILATALIEKLAARYPEAQLDFLLRKGNEGLLKNHPKLNKVLVFNKQKAKYRNLISVIKEVRKSKYDYLINVQRFFTTGLITVLSKAKFTVGFDKNPWSWFFGLAVAHKINVSTSHETERNQQLIARLTDNQVAKPRLYPSEKNYESVKRYKKSPFICIAPTSVWFTKQLPSKKWVGLINSIDEKVPVYLLGAPEDKMACKGIAEQANRERVTVLAGEVGLLESAALMKDAILNYVNDSAPMHLCSAMDAPVCAVFCSTLPSFGFGPLSDQSFVVETEEVVECRPCGLHGHKSCPEGHFNCANSINTKSLNNVYESLRKA